MKAVLAFALLLAGCASYRDLHPGQSSFAEVEAVMGRAVEQRARPDGKLIALEQRLSEEYLAKLIANHSGKEDVRELLGPPYERSDFSRMNREVWSWHMRRFGDLPVGLHVQMSPDGVVREVYLLDEGKPDRWRFFR